MQNYNRITMTGHLTRDPELRYTAKGVAVCALQLASNYQHKGDGELPESSRVETCFIEVVAWKGLAEISAKSLNKGSHILVEGRLKMDTWEDTTTGVRKSKHKITADSIHFLDKGSREENSSTNP